MAQVVQRRSHVDGQREVLLLLQASVPTYQRGQARPVDVLEHDVRSRSVEVVAQTAHHHRVVDRGQGRDLPAQAAPGGAVGHLVGTEQLDDDG